MGRRAIHPKDLADLLHAWDAAFQRRKKGGRSDATRDAAAAVKLLRRAERVLRRCVYGKRTLIKNERAPLVCIDCGGQLSLEEFNDLVIEDRAHETRCPSCARRHARASGHDGPAPATPATPAAAGGAGPAGGRGRRRGDGGVRKLS